MAKTVVRVLNYFSSGATNIRISQYYSLALAQVIQRVAQEDDHSHSDFIFISSVLVNLLQLKYQGDHTPSPFDSNTGTIFLALACLLLYCYSRTGFYLDVAKFLRTMAMASLVSLLLPSSFQTTALVSFSALIVASGVFRWAKIAIGVLSSNRSSALLPVHVQDTYMHH